MDALITWLVKYAKFLFDISREISLTSGMIYTLLTENKIVQITDIMMAGQYEIINGKIVEMDERYLPDLTQLF